MEMLAKVLMVLMIIGLFECVVALAILLFEWITR